MYRLKQLIVLIGDLLTLYVGLYFAIFLRYLELPNQSDINSLIGPFSWLFLAAATIAFISGLYDLGKVKNNSTLFKKIFFATVIWVFPVKHKKLPNLLFDHLKLATKWWV